MVPKAFGINGEPKAESITSNSALIEWFLTDVGQGEVEYGDSKNLGIKNRAEESFEFSKHTQPLLGLKPDTTYYYRVKSINEKGEEVVSNIYSFQTKKAAVVEEPPTRSILSLIHI